MLVNLATADLIVGTITCPTIVYVHMKEGLNEKIIVAEVIVIHMSLYISCTASVLSLSSLAIERYLAVRKPNAYHTKMTNKRILLTVVAVWLISLGLPILYFSVGYIAYAFIFANTVLVMTVAITCLTYVLMLRKVRERSRNMSSDAGNSIEAPYVVSQSTSNLPGVQSLSTSMPNSVVARAREMEAKVTKMFMVVLIAMLCSYAPSTVLIYIRNFCESCSCITLHWSRDFQSLLIMMNSSVNFGCYALQSPRFRSAFMKILKIMQQNSEPSDRSTADCSRRRKTGRKQPQNQIELRGMKEL